MAIPFLPAALIVPTYTLIDIPVLPTDDMLKLEKLKNYFKKRWHIQISHEELSIHEINFATNNGAESYHSKLKSRMRCSHPRIWTFMTTLNEIIKDTDNDISRLYQGRKISRARSKTDIKNEEHRIILKQKLSDGDFTPWEFLKLMSCTVGNINTQNIDLPSDSELSEDDGGSKHHRTNMRCLPLSKN